MRRQQSAAAKGGSGTRQGARPGACLSDADPKTTALLHLERGVRNVNTSVLRWVIAGYISLFLILGAMSVGVIGRAPAPPPQDLIQIIQTLEESEREVFFGIFNTIDARYTKFSDIVITSFQIVIGAIIGLLSTLASISMGRTVDSDNSNGTDLQKPEDYEKGGNK
jgi:hypothetical protein